MNDDGVSRVVRLCEDRGTVERIAGDTAPTARAWLDQAADDLEGVFAVLAQKRWRLAYKGGYDVLRNAVEAIVLRARIVTWIWYPRSPRNECPAWYTADSSGRPSTSTSRS